MKRKYSMNFYILDQNHSYFRILCYGWKGVLLCVSRFVRLNFILHICLHNPYTKSHISYSISFHLAWCELCIVTHQHNEAVRCRESIIMKKWLIKIRALIFSWAPIKLSWITVTLSASQVVWECCSNCLYD